MTARDGPTRSDRASVIPLATDKGPGAGKKPESVVASEDGVAKGIAE